MYIKQTQDKSPARLKENGSARLLHQCCLATRPRWFSNWMHSLNICLESGASGAEAGKCLTKCIRRNCFEFFETVWAWRRGLVGGGLQLQILRLTIRANPSEESEWVMRSSLLTTSVWAPFNTAINLRHLQRSCWMASSAKLCLYWAGLRCEWVQVWIP